MPRAIKYDSVTGDEYVEAFINKNEKYVIEIGDRTDPDSFHLIELGREDLKNFIYDMIKKFEL